MPVNLNAYKTRFFVVGMQPTNLMEICRLYCKNCLGDYSFKDMQTIAECPKCTKSNLEPCYMIQFWVKDNSTLNNVVP